MLARPTTRGCVALHRRNSRTGKGCPLIRFVIVGAGIIGLATARELRRRYPDATVTVVDKEAGVGRHQTGHNSGVVHAGLYYAPGSLKARLCTRGRLLLREFCEARDLPYEECGKLVVATHAGRGTGAAPDRGPGGSQRRTGIAVADRRRAQPDRATRRRRGRAPLAPHGDRRFLQGGRGHGGRPRRPARLRGDGFSHRRRRGGGDGPAGELPADRVVVCAGLQADRVARLAGDQAGPAIVAFRGEYWRLVPERAHLVEGLHLSGAGPGVSVPGRPFHPPGRRGRRRGTQCGAGPGQGGLPAPGHRAGRRAGDSGLAGIPQDGPADTGGRACGSCAGSLSKRAFIAEARRLVPEVTAADVVPAPAGVRAQAVDADGSLVDDFRIGSGGRVGPRW